MASQNRDKWVEALSGLSNFDAFKIIWDPKRELTNEQRVRLMKLHQSLRSPAKQKAWEEKLDEIQQLFPGAKEL